LLLDEDGVIETDNPVTSEKAVDVVVNEFVLLALTTCKTLPVVIAAGNAVTAPKDALAILP
jgi:hypothetical protein